MIRIFDKNYLIRKNLFLNNNNIPLWYFSQIRVRYAPSPTGDMHLGGIRTALYNYLYAKKHNGKFIVRIQDTDQRRHVQQATQKIFQTLYWLNIQPDQSMKKPDPKYQPYIQSQRLSLYLFYADKLIKQNKAFYCFCSDTHADNNLQNDKQKQSKGYNGKCLKLTKQEIEQKLKNKESYAIRIKSSFKEHISNEFQDQIYGKVKANKFDDFVIMKRDGFPTFHFANIIDDHKMEISHVIRGQEWLTNTPKHIYLYKLLNFKVPKFMHLPLLLSADGKKLSKRSKISSFNWVVQKGYLPRAVINFSALLGWASSNSQKQFFKMNELISQFDIKGISKNPVRVNQKKLNYFNKLHLKDMLQNGSIQNNQYLINAILKQIPSSSYFNDEYINKAKRLIIPRITNFSEINQYSYLFEGSNFSKQKSLESFKNSFKKQIKILIEYQSLFDTAINNRSKYNCLPMKIKSLKIESDLEQSLKYIIFQLYNSFKLIKSQNNFEFKHKIIYQEIQKIVNNKSQKYEIKSQQVYHLFRFIMIGFTNGPDASQIAELFGIQYVLKSLELFKNAI